MLHRVCRFESCTADLRCMGVVLLYTNANMHTVHSLHGWWALVGSVSLNCNGYMFGSQCCQWITELPMHHSADISSAACHPSQRNCQLGKLPSNTHTHTPSSTAQITKWFETDRILPT